MNQPVIDLLNLMPWKNNELEDDKVTMIILATFDGDYDIWALIQYAEHFQPAWKYGLFQLSEKMLARGWRQVHLFSQSWPNIPWVEAATLVRQYCQHPSTQYSV